MSNKILNSQIAKYAVHCPTEAESYELLNHWHNLGYTWVTGASLKEYPRWYVYLSDTIYFLENNLVTYGCQSNIPTITFAQYKANGFKFEGVNDNNEGVNSENEGVNNHANPSHYTDTGIEPWEVLRRYKGKFPTTHEAGLFAQVIQYLMRSPFKGQYLGDINKAKNLLIEWENYANNTGNNSDSNGTDKADV